MKPLTKVSCCIFLSGAILISGQTERSHAVVLTPSYPVIDQSSPSNNENNPTPSTGESVDQVFDFIEGGLDTIDDFIEGGISAIPAMFQSFFSIFGESGAALAEVLEKATRAFQLVNRIFDYPNKVANWWNSFYSVATGTLDPCLERPDVQLSPSISIEGLCFDYLLASSTPDGGGGGDGGSNGTPTGGERPKSIPQILEDSAGVQGQPVPSRVYQEVAAALDAQSRSGLGGGSFYLESPVNQFYQNYMRVQRVNSTLEVERVLGNTGQEARKAESQLVQGLTAKIQQSAIRAQGLNVTQDVMKQMTLQLADQATIASTHQRYLQQQEIAQGYTLQQLVAIQRATEAANQDRLLDDEYARSRIVNLSGQLQLF